ncbi:MAG: gluconokinase [Chloroflexi bacterium]|nr:gluconokinase [Chloroflexota bacterium]
MSRVRLADAAAPLALSLDIGSSSARAALYDARGRRVRKTAAKIDHRFLSTTDGGVTADAEALSDRVIEAIDEAMARADSRTRDIAAVGCSVFASSIVGVDAAGEALTPVYTYADVRNAADTAALRDEWDAPALYDRTGCPLHASYLAPRFRWLARTQPELLASVDRWVSFGEYLYERLFGRPCGLGVSAAAWSGLLDRRAMGWDRTTLDALGLDADALGRIDTESSPVRGLAPAWAERWPALAEAAWFPAVGDGVASNVGTAETDTPAVVVNLGTSAAVRAIVPGPVTAVPRGLWEYRIARDRSLLGGALTDGGNMVRWVAELTGSGPSKGWDAQVEDLRPDDHGVTLLPFLSGERSPGWDDQARATIHGLRRNTRAEELLLAGMEAVTYRLTRIYDLLSAELPSLHSVTLSGGGFRRSRAWAQMVADAFGRPATRSAAVEATSRGAALWALAHLGAIESPVAVDQLGGEALEPGAANGAVYRAAMERQERLYRRMAGAGDLGDA